MKNKRYGSLAALLNLFAPGAGFLYVGYWRWAVLTFFLFFSTIVFIGGSRFILSEKGLLAIFLLIVVTYLLTTCVVFFLARQANKQSINEHGTAVFRLNKGQRWYNYIAFIALSLLCAISLFKHRMAFLGYSVYLLPSASMASTLLPHDYIMVDTWIYQHEAPQKGDIVTFHYPLKPNILFIKRIIATAGDWVKIKQGQVVLNGRVQHEPYVLAANNIKTTDKQYQEWIVPKGHYFVLGDNRDGSNDSRYWGFVRQEAIQGKAMSIWFSYANKGGFRVRAERVSRLD